RTWQAHVMKHPFGVGAVLGILPGRVERRWNHEGWDETAPPVLTAGERAELVEAIKAIDRGGERCGIPRLEASTYRGDPSPDGLACDRCDPHVQAACAETTEVVGLRYRSAIEAAVARLHGEAAEVVPYAELVERLLAHLPNDVPLPAAVGSLGRAPNGASSLLRVSTPDGLIVELYVDPKAGRATGWRTTYRQRLPSRARMVSHLLTPVPRRMSPREHPLSDSF